MRERERLRKSHDETREGLNDEPPTERAVAASGLFSPFFFQFYYAANRR